MRLLLLTVIVATACVPAATAAPDGFRGSARLQPIAEVVSPGATVYCSTGRPAWEADITARFPSLPWNLVGGYRVGGTTEVRLAPWTCRGLEGWLRGKNVPTLKNFGVHVLNFAHEMQHTLGVTNESEADCGALRALPALLRDSFKVKRHSTLRTVMAAAWADHRTAPSNYRTDC